MRRLIESGYKISIPARCVFTPTLSCAGRGATADEQLISHGARAVFEIFNWLIIVDIKQAFIGAVAVVTFQSVTLLIMTV